MWQCLTKLANRLPPEYAHDLAIYALKSGLAPLAERCFLPVKTAGLSFDNPLGLAAGFDKDAEIHRRATWLGFAFSEVGTITPKPQAGNPKPRLFRLPQDEAVINRFGFNSKGMRYVRANLTGRTDIHGRLGINIGANNDTADKAEDYDEAACYLAHAADYLTINMSCPNLPDAHKMQEKKMMRQIIKATFSGRNKAVQEKQKRPPIFVKLSPDSDERALYEAMEIALECGVDGFILTNTTLARPQTLTSQYRGEGGGLSGKPLAPMALTSLIQAYGYLKAQGLDGQITLIGVGGIDSAEQAYARLLAGADLLQLYTALALKGPKIVEQILFGLALMIKADGVRSWSEIVGQKKTFDQALSHSAHIAKKVADSLKSN